MRAAIALANRMLEREAWARERLAVHAGKTLRLVVGPVPLFMAIGREGRFEPALAPPDLTLTVSPLRMPALLAQPDRWSDLVVAEGDGSLAVTLAELALTLPWFVEQAFATWLGPIAGVRAAEAGRRLLGLPDHLAGRIGDSVGSYLRDEAGVVLRESDLESFAEEIGALDERVDALAARVDTLSSATDRN